MTSLSLRSRSTVMATLVASLGLVSAASAAPLTLTPLQSGNAPTASSAGGLNGSWYKLDNDARFSTALYQDETGRTDQFQNYDWGTGLWAASDIAAIAAGQNPHVTGTVSSVGAVSYANNVYNNTQASGAYGSWGEDYARTVAPIIGGTSSCGPQDGTAAACSGEYNYAAVFSGYLYVAQAGLYDFGVFADDGFVFQLTGSNGILGMEHQTVAGSSGRDLYELVTQNGLDGLSLEQGYYGLNLSYFNRLEAGVVDLGWRGPGASAWRTIETDNLYHDVPEPATLALSTIGLWSLWGVRRRRQVRTAAQ